MSNHYEQKTYSVLALVSVNSNIYCNNNTKKGVIISEPIRKKFVSTYTEKKLHAALIYFLIKDIKKIKKIIICADVRPIEKVMSYLSQLEPGLFGRLKPLSELREEIGDQKLKSAADTFARNINHNFKKRKNKHRSKSYFHDGTILIFSIEYPELIKKLEKVLEKLKNK